MELEKKIKRCTIKSPLIINPKCMSKYLSILLASALIFSGCADTADDTDTGGTDNGDGLDQNYEYTLDIKDQEAGAKVMVDNVEMEKAGFVTIHVVESNGTPGAIIGKSSLLAEGKRSEVSVSLDRATLAEEKLVAIIHVDDGDGAFDEGKDAEAYKGDDPVREEFEIEATK